MSAAKKGAGPAALRAGPEAAPESLPVRPLMEPADTTPFYYVNYAEVSYSGHEFVLTATRMPAKLTAAQIEEAKKSGAMRVGAEVQLILPPTVIPGLIRALTTSKDGYEKLFETNITDIGAPNG